MKRYFVFAAALAVGMILTGCGSGTTTAATGTTVSVTHKYGTTEIPTQPKRAFVTLQRYADPLLALGIKPTTIVAYGNLDQLKGHLDGVTIISDFPVKPESVLAAAPDLIIDGPWGDENSYGLLAKVAPTIVVGSDETATKWRDLFQFYAKTFGKQAEHDAFMKTFDEKVAKTKDELAAKLGGETVMILRVALNRIMLWGKGTDKGFTEDVLYQDLGLKAPAGLPEPWTDISLEKLTDFDADHIFLEVRSTTEGSEQFFKEQVEGSAVWKSMKAVKNKHVYPITSDLWVEGNGPLSYVAVIDQIRGYLLDNK